MRFLRIGLIALMGLLLALAGKADASHPLPLVNISQWTSNDGTLVTGGTTFGSPDPLTVRLRASSDPNTWSDSCIYSLEVEVRPVSTPFSDTPTHTVVLGPKPDPLGVQVPYPVVVVTGLLPNTAYKWQCREVVDCTQNQPVSIIPNGGGGISYGPWTQFNGNATAFTTGGAWNAKFLIGYIPENSSGVGRFFFFDKNPFPTAQSWLVEVRRNDSNVYPHKRVFDYPGGPPPGDVAGTGTFVLPLLDAINFPTSFEIGIMIRIRVFSGLNATGTELYVSQWHIDVHPSSNLAIGPFLPGILPPPVAAGKQPVPFGDIRPTGPNLSVLYDLTQDLLAGPQVSLGRVGHGILGIFNEKKVHDPTVISTNVTVVSGSSSFFVRPLRRFRLNNGSNLGYFDVSNKTPNTYLVIP